MRPATATCHCRMPRMRMAQSSANGYRLKIWGLQSNHFGAFCDHTHIGGPHLRTHTCRKDVLPHRRPSPMQHYAAQDARCCCLFLVLWVVCGALCLFLEVVILFLEILLGALVIYIIYTFMFFVQVWPSEDTDSPICLHAFLTTGLEKEAPGGHILGSTLTLDD